MTRSGRVLAFVIAYLCLSAPVDAQSLDELIQNAPDGIVRISYAVKDGVCGNGDNLRFSSNESSDWEPDCEPGPARVTLEKQDGVILRVRTSVGGRWRSPNERVTDLGEVDSREAGAWLAELVERSDTRAARDAILAASVARDAAVWRVFLRVAQNETRPEGVRREVFQQLGILAGAALLRTSERLPEGGDNDVREQAIFAVSQLPEEESVPLLLEIAQTHRDVRLRRTAMFWLGQKQDDRALELFEEVLSRS